MEKRATLPRPDNWKSKLNDVISPKTWTIIRIQSTLNKLKEELSSKFPDDDKKHLKKAGGYSDQREQYFETIISIHC